MPYVTISTHTLTWSVTWLHGFFVTWVTFQLTRSRGAWQSISYLQQLLHRFQLTRSRGAWLLKHGEIQADENFNSHAHVERDCTWEFLVDSCVISTHTLTWSVTTLFSWFHLPFEISTHTLTWSVTRRRKQSWSTLIISTHTLTWSVTEPVSLAQSVVIISTHTLTWSVTPGQQGLSLA